MNATIEDINSRYEQRYDSFTKEGRRLSERAPEGAEVALGFDAEVEMKEHIIVFDLPTINMREKRIVLDLPQVTMKNRRFSFTTIKSKMENKQVGCIPEFRGIKIYCKPIIIKVPVFWEDKTEFVTKIPEFKVDQTAIVMHLPDIQMAEQRIVLDLPEFAVRDVNVETKRIEADARDLEARTKATAVAHKAEIAAVVERDLRVRKAEVAKQFDGAIKLMQSSINSLRSKGVDPANANGTNLIAELDNLMKQKANALAQINNALIETTS
ncbi:hypothetical protein [uncultured Ruegeria sp.]|uniref:hypothetical protein n=1 Tax=uncultured Ruegeria sp. TaxID=259304 RepID=UPI002608C885|nr:hypothetical protein [uncultured Ruegeria sp.]